MNTRYLEPLLDFYLMLLKIIGIIFKAFATHYAYGQEKYFGMLQSKSKKVVTELRESIMIKCRVLTEEKTLSNLKVSLEHVKKTNMTV